MDRIIVTPTRWGWQLEGNEETFTRIIAETFRPGFSYLEIGIGQCGTLRAVCKVCEQLGSCSRSPESSFQLIHSATGN